MYTQQTDDQENILSPIDGLPVKAFWEKKGFIFSCLFSAVWLAFIYDYIASSGWWGNRYDLSPAEFVGSFCGLFLPMVIVFLVTAYFDRSVQLSQEANQLKAYLNELVYPSQKGADYTKELTNALRVQIKEFRTVFAQVNKETQLVRDDLKQWIGDLSKIIKHVDSKTISSIREIAEHVQNLTATAEKANEAVDETMRHFAQNTSALGETTESATQKIATVSISLKNQITDVQNLAHALETANNRSNEALENAAVVVQKMEAASKTVEQAVENYANDAKQNNSRMFSNLEKVINVFKNQSVLLDNEVQKMTNRIGVLEDSLNGNTKGMIQASDSVLKELEGIDKSFEKTVGKIQKTLENVKKDVAFIENAVQASIEKAVPVFPTAKNQAQADLLQDATVILNRLQSFSVDMAHIFTPKAEDMLWQKYYDGDKAVFMRHITKMINESQTKKIVEFYKQNEDFRIAVARYMSEFEGMTKKASESQESNLLMSVLIGSDVGRLYMVLADVLKKEA